MIRKAELRDLPSLIEIITDDDLGKGRESSRCSSRAHLIAFENIVHDPNASLMVVELDGRVVGTLQMNYVRYLTFEGGKIALVENVFVLSAMRGQKIGEQMIHWAIEEARRQGCHRVQLTSHKTRDAAHRFYRRAGFEATHEGMKLYLLKSNTDTTSSK